MGRVIVIGAGPAGMMAAVSAARAGARVLLLEKNSQPGKKLLLTGHGRCNLTNIFAGENLPVQYPGGGPFLHSSLAQFPPRAICGFFQELGLEMIQEDQGRIFPRSQRAEDVLAALLAELSKSGVELLSNQNPELLPENGRIAVQGRESFSVSKVILATGGASYPATGSTGDGYNLAQKLGHRIISPSPALVPLVVAEAWARSLSGLSLPAQARLGSGKKAIKGEGQLLFTHFGLSGPLILNLSRFVTGEMTLELNLLPQARREDLWQDSSLTIGQRLDELLPRRLNRQLLQLVEIDPAARNLAGLKLQTLSELIFALPLTVVGTKPLKQAMVTRGGVDLREVNPKTMESKICPGLYFAGEILDLDGISGGYNLTAAFATGYTAGRAAAKGG